MVSDKAADAQDAIFEAASQTICEFATGITQNYQDSAVHGTSAPWAVGGALVVNGVTAMVNASADLPAEAISAICEDVLAYIGARIVEVNEAYAA